MEARKFADFRAAGINRVSVGVQSLDDDALRFLGRAHSAADAIQAITIAERTFERTSFDLIYALPGQSRAAWTGQLATALARDPGHLSLYQLTIERGTPFFSDHRNGTFILPEEDLAADLYELTGEMTDKAGLPAYEVSNHAATGQESRHNLTYWRGGDYIGIGPGAHGRLTIDGKRLQTEQIPGPANWLSAVAQKGHATRLSATVTSPEQIEEYLLMGLRLAAGIDRELFALITGRALDDCIDRAQLPALEAAGLVVADAQGLRATAAGLQRLNAIIAAIAA